MRPNNFQPLPPLKLPPLSFSVTQVRTSLFLPFSFLDRRVKTNAYPQTTDPQFKVSQPQRPRSSVTPETTSVNTAPWSSCPIWPTAWMPPPQPLSSSKLQAPKSAAPWGQKRLCGAHRKETDWTSYDDTIYDWNWNFYVFHAAAVSACIFVFSFVFLGVAWGTSILHSFRSWISRSSSSLAGFLSSLFSPPSLSPSFPHLIMTFSFRTYGLDWTGLDRREIVRK